MIKVVDNFLPKNEFVKIRDVICAKDFPFFYNGFVTDENKPSDDYYFTHLFFIRNAPNSRYFYLWEYFLEKIECKALIRIKANLYIKSEKEVIHEPHKDYDYPHKGCLFYINDNNGATYFKDKKVLPKANRAVFFKPNELHSSSLCTDQKRRITINFNYF
jgi:hypothetical protein